MLNTVSPYIVFGDRIEIETVDEIIEILKEAGFEHHFIYADNSPGTAMFELALNMRRDGAPPLRDQMVCVTHVIHTPLPRAPNAIDVTTIMAFRVVTDAVYVKMMLS